MQYEVYLDVLFLENMMMDFLILLAMKKIFPCTATYGSLLLGSFIGSLLTCLILFLPSPLILRYLLLFFLVNSCMLTIGLKLRTRHHFLRAWILLYLVSFLLGGIMNWLSLYLRHFFRTASLFFTIGVISFFLFYHGLLFLKKLLKLQNHFCLAILSINGKEFRLKAFVDSGNHLYDPLTGKPVHIISKNAYQRIYDHNFPEKFRYIPYQTIQDTAGVLPVITIRQMKISGDSERLLHTPLIGVSEQKTFGNGAYEIILHPKDC